MQYRFVCAIHGEFGQKGWRQEDQPDYDPLSGMAVAHDILEHFRRGNGSPADELQALGASFVVRGEDYFCQKGQHITSPALNVALDMPEIIRHVLYEDMSLPEPPRYRRRTDAYGEWVAEFTQEAKKLAREEFGEDQEIFLPALAVIRKSEGWLYRGIRRATQRYRTREDGYPLAVFCDIEREANKYLKWAEEGSLLIVTVTKHQATCRFVEYPDEEE